MSYPEPLAEEALRRLYDEAGLSARQTDFLRDFFAACANLYGVLTAREAWDVYRALSTVSPTELLHRRDMVAAVDILRREAAPYHILHTDQVSATEVPANAGGVVVLRELVAEGPDAYQDMYHIMKMAEGKVFYVPSNLLSYRVATESDDERELTHLLENLKVTASKYTDPQGNKHPCKYKGKCLKDFSYLGPEEALRLRRLRGEVAGVPGDPEQAEAYAAQLNQVSAARYLVNGLKRRSHVGRIPHARSTEMFLSDLKAMGVVFSEQSQVNALLFVVHRMHNHQHLWCNHGWTPEELAGQMMQYDMTASRLGL